MVKLFHVSLTKVDHTAALDELLHACIHKYTHLLIPFTHARSELFDVTVKNVFYRCEKKVLAMHSKPADCAARFNVRLLSVQSNQLFYM